MGIFNYLFGSEPKIKTYVIILQSTKPVGGSTTKRIELQLSSQEAADMCVRSNRDAIAKSLAAVHWPSAVNVKFNNGPTVKR